MSVVETEINESVMTVTLNDEDHRNALSRQLLSELMDAIDAGESDRRVRVIVVTNRGSTFCAGANLAERASPHPSGTGRRSIEFADLFQRIRRSPKPFVGRIAGHCVAGGVGLAAVMDISVAIDSAKFGFSEVRIGVAPAIISVVCLPKMRLADAQSAFLRGNRFSAEEAARIGLINMAVAPDELDREVEAVVNDLLAGEPHALAAAKQLSFSVPAMSAEEAFDWTSRLSGELFQSDEAREGMAAFLEKRPASWVERISRD
ncbi:MAG TPA: enoyl-CoA hydratase-related protein [Acidimicrobiales bacterium]|nr:enoyl-CoA hydratase-related protein [Acidimicrobiales bacterium]